MHDVEEIRYTAFDMYIYDGTGLDDSNVEHIKSTIRFAAFRVEHCIGIFRVMRRRTLDSDTIPFLHPIVLCRSSRCSYTALQLHHLSVTR